MTITPVAASGEAWGLACKHCDALVARHSQLSFLLENATAVHLILDKTLLHDEQLQSQGESDGWRVYSHSDVHPELQFTKIRTTNAHKRQRLPFELCCINCEKKIASEGFIDDLPGESLLLLDSRACSCVMDRKLQYGMAGGTTARKWGVILRQLQEMKLPLKIQTVKELNSGGTREIKQKSDVMPVVHPTEATIRSHFSPKARMSKLRQYQVELTLSAMLENTIVYLPTGCGKTLVAIKVMEEMKHLNANKLVVFFVPTGPLVSQQAGYIRRESSFKVAEFSGQHGHTNAALSDPITVDGNFNAVVVTPQFFLNLLFHGLTKITDYSVMVFDEAHHATGKHPYCELLQELAKIDLRARPHILALTASPFGEAVRETSGQSALDKLAKAFNAVVNAPTIAAEDLESSFIPKEAQWVTVTEDASERKLREGIKRYIESFYAEITRLMNGQVMPFETNYDTNDMELSQFLAKLRLLRFKAEKLANADVKMTGVQKSKRVLSELELILKHLQKVASSFYSLSIHGAGIVAESLRRIFSDLETAESTKGKRTFALIETAYRASMSPALMNFPLETFTGGDISSRVHLVADCIRKANFDYNSRAIVFVRRRKTAIILAKAMESLEILRELNPTRFVGHNSYEGMSWEEEQRPTLDRFRQGRIRLLVATNVLEEGLDVPECSLVIQFDGVIGVTSLIQSRGRARHRDSSFIIFCSAVGKERNQRLVENEKRLVLIANMTASRLESKATVKKLMDCYPEDVPVHSPAPASKDVTALTARATFDAKADKVYNIVLGGVFIDADRQLQRMILERVSEFASVRMADEHNGLCTVAASPDDSIYLSYNLLCSRVEFFTQQQQSFWMRFESDDMESAASGKMAEAIADVELRRGLMTPDGTFMELESLGRPGVLEMTTNALAASIGHLDVEFDMRSLCEPLVWFDLTSSARNGASLYLSFRLPPSYYVEDKRECKICQSQALVYRLIVPPSDDLMVHLWNLRVFFSKLGVEVRETKIPTSQVEKVPPTKLRFPLPVAYALQCFLSDCSYFTNGFLPGEFYDMLAELDPEVQEKALLSFRPHPSDTSVVDQFSLYLKEERPMLEGLCASPPLSPGSIVYKVIVTPSRIVYCPPDPAPSNRVFRHWGSENFMYVYFRDDNMERLDYTSDRILRRIRNVLRNGIEIPHVEGRLKFHFLGCSLSQVRNSSAIFTLLDRHEIRPWIGDLSQLESPAKYLKRLGQAFSSTKETFNVSQSVLDNPVNDIENGQYVFTDGCGEISSVGANSIAKELRLPYTPSAFQIRLGGAKGVLVVSDIGNPTSREEGIVLRKSMSKFASNHTMLEIVACAGKSEAYLTRQSVLILNDLGISEDVFMEMQEDFLSDLSSLIASDDGAYFELKAVLPPDVIMRVDTLVRKLGVKVLVDDYLSSLARTIYHYRLANTVMRARIPVPKGRTLMGVADFTGTLEYGEVFVQYSVTDEETGIDSYATLDGIDVAVHRSPCHHPGDIRVLRCRADVPPELSQVKDCIVFPSRGKRPHPDECTGGDLDGDMFVVIWDKRLIPSRAQVHEPMAFDEDTGGDTSPRGGEYHQSTDDEGLVDFYVHSIQDDILGIASNAHLALCDSSVDGSFDENAKILARICSKQVDSLRAEKDLEIVRKCAPKSYPDFMQNKDKPSYISKKILGKMFRRCQAIFDTTMMKDVGQMPIRDDHFLTLGYDDYIDQAEMLYRQYKLRVRALLLMSGAESEAELATGMIVEIKNEYKADYFRFGEQCKDAFYALQGSFRAQFNSDTSTFAPGEELKLAAACYFVAHNDFDASTRCLSFPWIVMDLLTTIKANSVGSTYYKLWTPVRLSAYDGTIPKLQLCMLAEIATTTQELLADLFDRLMAVNSLRTEMPANLKKKELDLILFGSSGLLTFEKQSDLDVMVRCTSPRGSLKAIAKAIEGSHGNIDLKDTIRVPLLSFSFQQWSIEMCMFSSGPIKTRLFRTYMGKYSFFWPCVYFLVRWGKCVGLIRRRSGGGLNMFSPTGFIWLFLRFCTEHSYVQPVSVGTITVKEILKTNDIDSEITFWTELLTRLVSGNEDASALSAADVLLTFFSYYAKLSTPFSDYGFTDPLDPENDTQLDPEAITLFRSECHIALHQLVIAQGDIKYLLTHREEQTSLITLSHALSTRVHEEKDFFSRKILFETRADSSTHLLFKFHPNSLRSDLYVAEIIGPGDAVQRIEDHIRMIEQELGAGMTYRSNRNFHHEGSSLLLFEGAGSQQEKIGFQDYFGERHGEHNNIRLHQAHLVCFMNGRQWYEHAGATFCAKFIQQMIKLSRYEHLNPGVTKTKAFVRFGHHYLINLPRSFDAETIMLASIKKLEDEFERGRTARELYEAVLIAKQKQREQQGEVNEDIQSPEADNLDEEADYSGEKEGWSVEEGGLEEGFYGEAGSGGGGGGRRQHHRQRIQLQKADTVARGDKGVTHSFYSMIEKHHVPWTEEYAKTRLGMALIEESDSYQVSIVNQSFEYNVRLTDELQLVKISTRPSRWFSATLKMRQEMDYESHKMDSTPDVRFYVNTTEDMPKTDKLYVRLANCCKTAPDGRGIIEFCDGTRDKVRISRHLIEAGESPACIGTVRHIRGMKYSSSGMGTQLSVMRIREFTIPDRNPEDGFMSVRDKIEAEFLLPPLTPERRVQPTFAREFLATGMAFVDYLRTQADLDTP
ncbi:RNA-dependent RNA polymerase 1 [Phytophthora citrophthora]|uniref:RNA-directed RNA polymerase n=1 Tax=Phytophthora citrophthora TaxID=4793 RepID=A0AAD9GSP6_9STRA|nr:RNA-dependent RNA polymerase 1 [Phytophthora citrophthora]